MAVTVITYIAAKDSTQGLLAVPCVLGQLVQIFVGQPLAHYMAGRIARWREAKAEAAAAAAAAPAESAGKDVDGAVVVGGAGVGGGDVERGQ